MKRLTILILLLLCAQLFTASASDITVDSASQQTIVLSVSNLKTVDLKINSVTATAETDTVSDTYSVDATAKTEGNKVLISINIGPIFQDYPSDQIKAITVSGTIDIAGETIPFGKRVPYRSSTSQQNSEKQLAPALSSTNPSTILYIIVGLSLVLVLLILFLFYNKPKRKMVTSKTKKRKTVKKKVMRKAKKRL